MGAGAPTLQHRLEYALFRGFRRLLLILPELLALATGSGAGWLAGSVLRIRRGVVDANLALAFPDRPPAWRRRVAAASYRHLGREAVAMFRMSAVSAAEVRSRIRVTGLEPLRAAMEAGGGAVMVTGHLGNWEVGGAGLAAWGIPVDAVAFRQRNRLFDRDLVENRKRLGIRIVYRSGASREMMKALEEGRVAGLVADQNARWGGVFVDFFGVPASTAQGPALFALRTGAPLFVGAALREPGSPARYHLEMEEVRIEPTGELEEDVRRLTQAHTAALERWVRQAPEQYFWHHMRWKTRPPDEAERPRP